MKTEFRTTLDRLAAAPAKLERTDPQSGSKVSVTIGPIEFESAVASLLADVQSAAGLPAWIHRAFKGEWAALAQAYLATASGADPRVTLVSSQTIACSDEWAAIDPAGVRNRRRRIGVYRVRGRDGPGSQFAVQLLAARERGERRRPL